MIKTNSIIYLSHFINTNTPIYGGIKNKITIEQVNSISKGDSSNNTFLSFPAHVGTHIDFPYHFNTKAKTSSQYDAAFWIFSEVGFLECQISDIEYHLNKLSSNIELLILKTGFGNNREKPIYYNEQPVINSNLAKKIKNCFPKLRIFGFDLISLTSKLDRIEGKLAHQSFLLEEDILILEDMKLDCLNTTPKTVIVSPLLIHNIDGAPCTVIAIQ